MIENEVKYRLCKLILTNIQGNGLLTEEESAKICELLREKLNPPFKSVENLNDKIGDGVKVNER